VLLKTRDSERGGEGCRRPLRRLAWLVR
jgi:hypothetical protein